MAKVLIIGGHGKVALLAAPLLVEAGHTVTSVVRNPDHTAEVGATGAVPLVADVENASTDELASLIGDHEVVVWSAGAGGGSPKRTRAVDRDAAIRSMDAAVAAGVRHYVMVSYFGSRPDHGVPSDEGFWHYAEAKAAADEHLRGSGLPWTILGPSRLTLAEPTGRIEAHLGSGPQGTGSPGEVSRANVARVIAAVVDAGGPLETTIGFHDGDTPIEDVVRQGR